MNFSKYCCFFTIVFFASPLVKVSAQYNVDSLRILTRTLPDGLDRLNAYKDLAFVHYARDGELAERYCDTICMIADRAKLTKAKSKAEYFRAAIAMSRGDNFKAIEHIDRGMQTLEP